MCNFGGISEMASAEVLPNGTTSSSSKKQELLLAGKRRLEEFRRKKEAEKAKKATSTSQSHVADSELYEKPQLEAERIWHADSDGVGVSDRPNGVVAEPSGVLINNSGNEVIESVKYMEQDSSNGAHSTPLPTTNKYSAFSAGAAQTHGEFPEKSSGASSFTEQLDFDYSKQKNKTHEDSGISGAHGGLVYGFESGWSNGSLVVRNNGYSSNHSSYSGFKEAQSVQIGYSLSNGMIRSPSKSNDSLGDLPPENASVLQNKSVLSSGSTSNLYKDGASPLVSERNYLDHLATDSAISGTSTRRARPSFLDSINISRVTSASPSSLSDSERVNSLISGTTGVRRASSQGSSASWKPFTDTENVKPLKDFGVPNMHSASDHSTKASDFSSNESKQSREGLSGNQTERGHEYLSPKQDEDFAALEQHIEDLTQGKFSLQRALDAARSLSESLASENSSLTDSYNQQGSIVNQLKAEMEEVQEEIKAQLVELEATKIECTNAQLECNAADARAKLLASEVIGLEEKTLRLKSNELKLERQLENSLAEISSLKKKISSLEKDRQDLQMTIDALKEEKKLLQLKLRKASSNGKWIDISKNVVHQKDASTGTEDLGYQDNADNAFDISDMDVHLTSPLLGGDVPCSISLPVVLSLDIPADQMKMVQSINALVSELALEKEELMQALAAESTQSAKLKDLNQDLSRKLEAQTQRLELLTAQNMAYENISGKQLDSQPTHNSTVYADEGDEVVERVLGWIMKLFPGGPSRRRISKLL